MKFYRLFLFLFLFYGAAAQDPGWQQVDRNLLQETGKVLPNKYSVWTAPAGNLTGTLSQISDKRPEGNALSVPLPNGEMLTFDLKPYALMHPQLAARFPDIKAFKGYDPGSGATLYLDWSPKGLHFTVRNGMETYYMDPVSQPGEPVFIAYNIRDYPQTEAKANFSCDIHELHDGRVVEKEYDLDSKAISRNRIETRRGVPVEMRTYRVAVAATAEFTQSSGGSVEDALANIVVILNRVNSIYENEFSISLQLVANNDLIIYTEQFDDPFTNGNAGEMLDENQEALDTRIGFNNYDIGHVLGTDNSANGLAQVLTVCRDGKARAASLAAGPITEDPFVVNIVSHELGHQFGARHTMYHCHNVNPATAYEPGSGSTIMSYAGICSPATNNVEDDAGPYFHANSAQAIINYSRFGPGNNCPVLTDIGNSSADALIPYPNNLNIPASTPLRLIGEGFDAEGDPMTFNWEQYDIGPSDPEPILGNPSGNAPLFRSYEPDASPTRYIPALEHLTQNSFYIFEILPDYSRSVNFRFLVRDNHPGGGTVSWDQVQFNVTDEAGPFVVMHPSENGLSFGAGDMVEISWDPAGTDSMPVNSQEVEILLSVDGGVTYPYTLSYGSPNDGVESVLLPDVRTQEARIMVAATDNVFFDISNNDFEIAEPTVPGYYLNFDNTSDRICLPELLELEMPTSSFAGYNDTVFFDILANELPAGDVGFISPGVPAGETNVLRIDLQDVAVSGTYSILFETSSINGVTFQREVELELVSNDFSAFELLSPADGASNLGLTPTFEWMDVADADDYYIEIASSPDFTQDVVYTQSGIQAGFLDLPTELESNSVYFWRMGYRNTCGSRLHSQIFAFQTFNIDCLEYPNTDGNISIPSSGTPQIESTVTVSEDLTIDDLNLRDIVGFHLQFGQLTFTLVAPDGTEVVLLDGICDGGSSFNFGFSDEASTAVGSCILEEGRLLRPVEQLSPLYGTSSEGDWTLRINDNESGSGGSLESWTLEFCANLQPNNPFLVTNDTLDVKPGKGRLVQVEFLEADDIDNTPPEITFTVVQAPFRGQLFLDDGLIGMGDSFTQEDVNSGLVRYNHLGSEEETDFFTFVLTDPGGGFFGTPRFNIRMDTSADATPVRELLAESGLKVFPNPAKEGIWVEWEQHLLDAGQLAVYDLHGRVIRKIASPERDRLFIPTATWPAGLYLLRISDGKNFSAAKFRVE